MKKYISLLIAVFLLCSCSQNTAEVTETSVTSSVTAETTAPEETEQTKTEPPVTSAAETTVSEITVSEITTSETTVTETEKIVSDFYSTDDRVQDYMKQLTELESFKELIPQAAKCLICDMDSNGTPEVVIQIGANRSLSAVFSVDDEGAFMAEPAGGTYFTDEDTWRSYDGEIPQSFILLGQDQYFAECFNGGSVWGQGGVIKLNLNGRKISSESVGEWSYGTKSYTYRGFENEEQYNNYIKTFFGNLEPQWKLMPSADFIGLDVIPNENHITPLLKEYYSDREALAELEEQLDDDLSFKTEFKPFYMRAEDFTCDNVYSESYSYDYMGNPAKNSYGAEMIYTYYPNGKVKTCTTEGSTAEYDESGNIINRVAPDELTYDEKGRVKTRTTYSRDFYNGGYSIHDVTEYFYKDDTDEVIKMIRTYNTNTTETSLYENGLEVSFEWHDPDRDYYAKRIQLREYTPDGLIAKTEFFDGNRNLARTITYDYDSENRLIREESVTTDFYWDESDRCIDYVFSYKYDDDGKLLLKTEWLGTYNGDTLTWEYIYDENGNLIEEIRTNDGDNEMVGYSKGSFVTRNWYEFDLAGNVIKVTSNYEDEYITVTKYRAVRTLLTE